MTTRKTLQKFILDNKYSNEIILRNNQYFENQYISSLYYVIKNGVESGDRTGTGTIRSEIGQRFVFDSEYIPLLRGKLVNPHNALTEVIWVLTGRNDLKWLKDNGVNYWDSWVNEAGNFGPIYGPQMRNQNGFDQLLYVINKLNESPESRQALINLWHGSELSQMSLPPCHNQYHPLIVNNRLHLHCGQRSSDAFLGVPYDYMLFYFIQRILCYWTNTKPGNIIHTNNDYHIYQNQYASIAQYFENYFNNPQEKDFDSHINIELEFPDKDLYINADDKLSSDDLTQWLNDFYLMNKNFKTNYSDKNLRYGLIKTNIAV